MPVIFGRIEKKNFSVSFFVFFQKWITQVKNGTKIYNFWFEAKELIFEQWKWSNEEKYTLITIYYPFFHLSDTNTEDWFRFESEKKKWEKNQGARNYFPCVKKIIITRESFLFNWRFMDQTIIYTNTHAWRFNFY